MQYLLIVSALLVLACSNEDAHDSSAPVGAGPDGSDAVAPPPDGGTMDASGGDATADASDAGAPQPDGAPSPDATTDARAPKPVCSGPWQTSLVAPGGLSRLAVTAAGEPYVTTGEAVWSRSGGSWAMHPVPAKVGDIAIVPETGEIHLCGQQCDAAVPPPPEDWYETPPSEFCRGVHVAGAPGSWTVNRLPPQVDNGYDTCPGVYPYYVVRWPEFPCSIDARADGAVEIVQRSWLRGPRLEVCPFVFYRYSKRGTWSLEEVGAQRSYLGQGDRVNVRLDSSGAAHWNTNWYGVAVYDTAQAAWNPWRGNVPAVSDVALGSVRLALDSRGAPTFAGASWSSVGPGVTDSIFFVAPGATPRFWQIEEIAATKPTTTVDTASASKPGLAYMQNGEPIVCWAEGGLRCAARSSGTWTETLVDTDADDSSETEVRVAANGCCHIAYRGASGAIRHATDCN